MIRSRCVPLALSAMLLGVMAFGVTTARAEVGAKWLLAERAPGTKSVPFLEVALGLKSETTLVLHSEILKVKVLFLCTWIDADIAMLIANGSIGGLEGLAKNVKIRFSSCTTDLNGTVAPECTPTDKGVGGGTIVTNPLHGLIVLGTSKEDLIAILPDTGNTLAVIELPAACPIGTKVPVIGQLKLKDCQNLALSYLVEHLLEEGPGTKLFTISETAEHAATLLGSVWAFLTGGDSGLKFSADPA